MSECHLDAFQGSGRVVLRGVTRDAFLSATDLSHTVLGAALAARLLGVAACTSEGAGACGATQPDVTGVLLATDTCCVLGFELTSGDAVAFTSDTSLKCEPNLPSDVQWFLPCAADTANAVSGSTLCMVREGCRPRACYNGARVQFTTAVPTTRPVSCID